MVVYRNKLARNLSGAIYYGHTFRTWDANYVGGFSVRDPVGADAITAHCTAHA